MFLKVDFSYELTMYVCIFNLPYFINCYLVFYMNGNYDDMGSHIISSLLLVLNIAILIVFYRKRGHYYRFRLSFKSENISYFHYYLLTVCITCSIFLLVFTPNHTWTPFVPQGLFLVYTIVQRPYL